MNGTIRGGCPPRSLRVCAPLLTRKTRNVQRELLLSSCAKSQNSQAARFGPVGPATDSQRPCFRLLTTRAHASRSSL